MCKQLPVDVCASFSEFCVRVAKQEAHDVGVFCRLLDFVRVHAQYIPVQDVQGRVLLRDAARAWKARGPAAGGSDVTCAEFLKMYLSMLEV